MEGSQGEEGKGREMGREKVRETGRETGRATGRERGRGTVLLAEGWRAGVGVVQCQAYRPTTCSKGRAGQAGKGRQ